MPLRSSGPDVEVGDFPDPEPTAGRRVVDVVAAGIHPLVRSLVAGRHYGSSHSWPAIPGVDCVARTEDGELIYTGFAQPPYGTLAERVSVPVALGVPLPESADPLTVAAGVNPGVSSFLPLQHLAGRPPGSTVLITGASGAAGRLAVQNARLLGAGRIIAVGRDRARLAPLTELGASELVTLSGDAAADADALRATFAAGVPDLVLDFVWGPVATAVLGALTTTGFAGRAAPVRYVEIGALAGASAQIPADALRSRPIEIVGSGAGSVEPSTILRLIPRYLELLASGALTVSLREFPLSRVAEAWAPEPSGVRTVVVPAG